MSRIASRPALFTLALSSLTAACSGGASDRAVTVARMPPAEAAMAAARAEESAVRNLEALRRSFKESHAATSCFDTLDIDRAELCGDDYAAHFLFEWSDCPVFGARTSGRILIDNVRDTIPAGGQCANPSGWTADHASSYDFAAELSDGSDHEVHVSVDASGTLAGDGSPREMASDVSVQALGLGGNGNLLYDAQVTSDWSSVWTTAGTATVVVSGSSEVHLTVLQRDYDVTATNLTFREDCCHPVAGTVSVTSMVAATSFQATASFGPACGDAVVDGTPVTLAPCAP